MRSAAATSRSIAVTASPPMARITAAFSTFESGPAAAARAAAARTRRLIARLSSPMIRTTSTAVVGDIGPSSGSIDTQRDANQVFSTSVSGVVACLRIERMAGVARSAIRFCSSGSPLVASTCRARPTQAAIRTAAGRSALERAVTSTVAAAGKGLRSADCSSPISSMALTRTTGSASSLPASDSMNVRKVFPASSAAFSLVISASRNSLRRLRTRSIVGRFASSSNWGKAICSRNSRGFASNAAPLRMASL